MERHPTTVIDRDVLAQVCGGIGREDFERYGEALGKDMGSFVGFGNTGGMMGRDLGGHAWDYLDHTFRGPGRAGRAAELQRLERYRARSLRQALRSGSRP